MQPTWFVLYFVRISQLLNINVSMENLVSGDTKRACFGPTDAFAKTTRSSFRRCDADDKPRAWVS